MRLKPSRRLGKLRWGEVMRVKTRALLLSATAMLLVASTSALADGSSGSSGSPTAATTTRQGPAAPGTPKAEDSRKIEKVTVTATRRRTAAQKTDRKST